VIRKGYLVQEVKVGDTVLLHLPNGSAATRMVVNVISSTKVQLVNFEISDSAFDATTAPIYKRGTHPGQWEPTNEEPPEEFKKFGEGLRMADHPTTRMLHSLLNIKLSADVEDVFLMVGRIYADKDVRSPFYEVQHRDVPFNDVDYFYNLLTMGVQEGLRSTLYFLLHFLSLAEKVKVQGAAIVADVKPSHSGTLAIRAPILNANYEGFILLSRATLDRLNHLFKYYFQISPKKRISHLHQLMDELKRNYADDRCAQGLIMAINRHSTYLSAQFAGQDQPTERNRLAHQEYVEFASPNIMYSPNGMIRVALIYKGILQADATEELTDRFNKLKLFIIDILNEFFVNNISETPLL
jgi:hypothetical protein